MTTKARKAAEAESREWMVRCSTCSFERSVWDAGTIRYRSKGLVAKSQASLDTGSQALSLFCASSAGQLHCIRGLPPFCEARLSNNRGWEKRQGDAAIPIFIDGRSSGCHLWHKILAALGGTGRCGLPDPASGLRRLRSF